MPLNVVAASVSDEASSASTSRRHRTHTALWLVPLLASTLAGCNPPEEQAPPDSTGLASVAASPMVQVETLMLQPGTEGKDASVWSRPDQVNTPDGATAAIRVQSWTWQGTPGTFRSLIDFDIPTLPPGATLTRATLHLSVDLSNPVHPVGHSQDSGSNEMLVIPITSPWEEKTVTWNTQPSIDSSGTIVVPRSTSYNQSYQVDVTSIISRKLAAPGTIHGMMLRLQTEQYYRAVQLISSDHPDAALRPKLEIQYIPPPQEPSDTTPVHTVLEEGNSWQLVNVQGESLDDTIGAYNVNLYVLQNETGINSAPLTPGLQDDLDDDVTGEDTAILVDQKIANEIAISEQQGYLTPYLESIAEPREDFEPAPIRPGQVSAMGMFGKCSNKAINKSKTFNLTKPVSTSEKFNSHFEGSLTMTSGIQASATAEVHLELKRYAIFWACIPYGVKFNNARAHGTMELNSTSSLSGTIKYTQSWKKQIADVKLFTVTIPAGPIPIPVNFTLPITIGLDLQATVTGTVGFHAARHASGSFDYTCTLGGCVGGASFNMPGTVQDPVPVGAISGHLEPSIWVQAAVRAALVHERLVYAQVGVRPYLRADLWGYYGNACGDADGDGIPETVDALTLDLDWQLYVTGEAALLNTTPDVWDNLWNTGRRHIAFWDLIGSEAAQPVIVGPATAQSNVLQAYGAKMRPCWPYSETVDYQFNWGDGTTTALSGAPQSQPMTNHAWSPVGARAVTLTPLRDGHGRKLDSLSSTRTINVTAGPVVTGGSHSFEYSANNTNYASQNTINRAVTLAAGQTLTVGTCGVDGASGTGDTYLRLSAPLGSVVAVNDDACGVLSKITYTVPPGGGGVYTLMAGCYASGSCSGRVTWTVSGSFYYSASSTSSATVSTANYDVALVDGETLTLGTCNVPGSSGTGDTYLRLNNATSTQVSYNDDSCGGYLSYLTYTVPAGGAGKHQLRAGCWSSNSCDGTVAYVITGP